MYPLQSTEGGPGLDIRDSNSVHDSPGVYDTAEFADNPEARCSIVMMLDVSGSMEGPPIETVNQALTKFRDAIREDVLTSLRADVAVIAFNEDAWLASDFSNGTKFEPPVLTAHGGTNYSKAINLALDTVESRKRSYRDGGIAYYRSLAYFLTDGIPTDSHADLARTAARLAEVETNRGVAFFSFVIRNDFDLLFDLDGLSRVTGIPVDDLQRFISSNDNEDSPSLIDLQGIANSAGIGSDKLMELGRTPRDYLEALVPSQRPPVILDNLAQVAGSIEWLSRSVAAVSRSQPGEGIRLPSPEYRNF